MSASASPSSSYGFALKVAPDLAHFAGTVPCGIAAIDLAAVKNVLAVEFVTLLSSFLAHTDGHHA